MKTRATRREATRPESTDDAAAVARELQRVFTPQVIDELREATGDNPRQRVATAFRVMLTVVEAFLLGQTPSFASLRAIFVRRFGTVRSCPFQKRFKQASAALFFRSALGRLVQSVVDTAATQLRGPLAKFSDVRLYDGTGQRVPPRGRRALPSCTKDRAGAKWVVGYSLKTGLLEEAICGPETASETPLWHALVPNFIQGALYVFDLGFFERRLFAEAREQGAHVLMRLKKTAKVPRHRPAPRRCRPTYRPLVAGRLLSRLHSHEEEGDLLRSGRPVGTRPWRCGSWALPFLPSRSAGISRLCHAICCRRAR